MAPLGHFIVDCCRVMDGLWHLRRLGPKPSGPQRHGELQPLHQLHCLCLKTTGAHRDISIWNEACTVRTVSNAVQHYPTLIFYSLHSWAFSAAAYTEVILLPACCGLHNFNTLQWQGSRSRSLSLPFSFHLYSLHDDTPAMLSWQQSGPDCLVARQLTSPIRGTWRYRARDKQITQNMCACTWLCWVWAMRVWTLTVPLAHAIFFIQMFSVFQC